MGKNAFETVAERDHERAMKNFAIAIEKGSIHNIEYEIVRKDGHMFPANLSASAIKDASGNIEGFISIAQNITQRKKAESALKESEAMLRDQKLELEQKNIALREIIAQIEIEKRKIKDDITTNNIDRSEMELDEVTSYPDIIIHRRMTNKKNILVIEIKKSNSHTDSSFDYEKLRAYTSSINSDGYGYSFGVFLRLHIGSRLNDPEFKWFINGQEIS